MQRSSLIGPQVESASECAVPWGREFETAGPAAAPPAPRPASASPRAAQGFLDGAESLLNRWLAAVLLVPGLPLLGVLAAAVLVTSGRPVFYTGTRLGRNRKPFQMYKLRTLVTGAEQLLGGRLLTGRDDLVIPLGWLLRDTRLDELPQLFNILRGDMNFVGPRPERPAVYEAQCRSIPGYNGRFAVKPGLIGYAQLFTPHNTPKRIRALIDNRMLSRRPHPLSDLLLIAYTAAVVAVKSVRGVMRFAWHDLLRCRILRRDRDRRQMARVQPERAAAIVRLEEKGIRFRAPVLDMSETAFTMVSGEALDPLPARFDLVIRVGRNGRTRRLAVPCRGRVSAVRPVRDGYRYVVAFEPVTDRGRYVVHQHFLKRSLAVPTT